MTNGGGLVTGATNSYGTENYAVCAVIVSYRLTMAALVSFDGTPISSMSFCINLEASLTIVGITGSVRAPLNGSIYLYGSAGGYRGSTSGPYG